MTLPVFDPPTTFFVLLGIMVLRYFALSGAFYLYCGWSNRGPIIAGPKLEGQNKQDILWSLASSVVFALSGTVLVELWRSGQTKIYYDASDYGVFYLVLSLLLLMVLHDTYFYWTHRLLHLKALFGRFHMAHHRSRVPTAWTSFAFHPVEALIQAVVLPMLVLLIPVHWAVLATFLALMTLFGLLNHLGYELYPAFLETRLGLINANHHQQHHQHVKGNFGLYFTWWDHLMKTEGRR